MRGGTNSNRHLTLFWWRSWLLPSVHTFFGKVTLALPFWCHFRKPLHMTFWGFHRFYMILLFRDGLLHHVIPDCSSFDMGCRWTQSHHFHPGKGKSLSSQLAVLTRASAAGASQDGQNGAPVFHGNTKATHQQFLGYFEHRWWTYDVISCCYGLPYYLYYIPIVSHISIIYKGGIPSPLKPVPR